MSLWQRILHEIKKSFSDEGFLHNLEKVEGIVSKILSIVMVIVILVSVADLIIVIFVELINEGPSGILKDTLFKIFGLFLNVLIALEILENITAYLKKHVIQVELVIVTSLIAVARKIIILDLEKKTAQDLIGLSIAIASLSISYWVIRTMNNKQKE